MNIKSMVITNSSNVKFPLEKIHHFVATPSLSIVNKIPAQKSPKYEKTSKLKPLPDIQKGFENKPAIEHPIESDLDSYDPMNMGFMDFEVEFENFMVAAYNSSYITAIEEEFKKRWNAVDVILWEKSDGLHSIFSFSHHLFSENFMCLAGACYLTDSIINTTTPTEVDGYSSEIDSHVTLPTSPNLLFPLKNYRKEKQFVVQVVMPPCSGEFPLEDINFVKFFQRKFSIFCRYLIDTPLQEPILLDFLKIEKIDQTVHKLSTAICSILNCRSFEVWVHDKQKKKMVKYTKQGHETVDMEKLGPIGNYIKNEMYINATKIDDPNFPDFDDTPTLIIPISNYKTQVNMGVLLRGDKNGVPFNPEAERIIRQFAPVISLAITNAIEFTGVFSDYKKSSEEREGLSALLEVAEILSRQLDIARLCEIIMEKGRYLTQADRCSLFLVSADGHSLTTSFHRGLKEGIEIPITQGVVGKTVTEAKPLNIEDAYMEPSFSPATDIQTGYKTKSILSVPIFNNRGKVMGVTEMINKKNGQVFTTWDTNLIQIFNVFCGISLENARLYNESLDMSHKLRSFFGISFSLNKTEDIKRIMTDIIKNARKGLNARRASMFILDDSRQMLKSFIIDGGKIPATFPITEGIIGACARTKTAIFTNDPKSDTQFNPKVDEQTGFQSTSLCAAPMLSTEGQVLGVVEMVNKITGNFSDKDLELLQAFASFAAISLENSQHKAVIPASVRSARPLWINDQRPEKMLLSTELLETMVGLNFNAQEYPDEDLIRMVFTFFISYGACDTLRTSKETFLKFFYEIRLLYNDLPYHNWRHACDVVQFLTYELKLIDAGNVFKPIELAAILIAAICHDVGHDGYTNTFNNKAQSPLGILYRGQSACEMYHCSLLVHVISNLECNIFANMAHKDMSHVFELIVELILATDINESHKIVDEVQKLIDNNQFDITKEESRIPALKILLMVANISNVTRPFDAAMRWCDSITDEFFKQGDVEKRIGIGLTSPYNDRNQPNKPGLESSFIGEHCIPIVKLAAEIFPKLNDIFTAVNNNLERWKTKNQ